MSIISTDSPISSRTFDARTLKRALKSMPSSQKSDIYNLANTLNKHTSMGYYAALEFIANLGIFLRTKDIE